MKKTIQFTIVWKRIKYLGIKVPQEAKDLYSENNETLMKEIKDDTNRKIHHAFGLEESMVFKWLYYSRKYRDSAQSLLI